MTDPTLLGQAVLWAALRPWALGVGVALMLLLVVKEVARIVAPGWHSRASRWLGWLIALLLALLGGSIGLWVRSYL